MSYLPDVIRFLGSFANKIYDRFPVTGDICEGFRALAFKVVASEFQRRDILIFNCHSRLQVSQCSHVKGRTGMKSLIL